jgi:phage terminase Nu1 subunit (DNA packaging protein)
MANNEFCRKTADGRILLNTSSIAKAFNTSIELVSRKWSKQGCPKEERGWWDISEVIKWRGLSRNEGGEDSAEAKKLKADADTKFARARQEELKLQEMLGSLVPIEMVKGELNYTFTDIKQRLSKLPNDIRVELYTLYPEHTNEVTEIVERKVRECLSELSSTNDKFTSSRPLAKPAHKRGRPSKKAVLSTTKANSK